ncbi:hypothetical protein HPB47_000996 [Ixodes persulcatus]|uniref:Uncharacterized protein n=1 Tax=Ixodes persulcatus TaxID=34615 RepID=A0AC60PRQ5_IXOPE|nr:hypothetical protein HPB47_000996 [Ixodes persulcatus]
MDGENNFKLQKDAHFGRLAAPATPYHDHHQRSTRKTNPNPTFKDYVQCDDAAWTSAELTTDNILNSVREQNDCSDEENANDEDEEATVTDQQEESVSNSHVLSAISKLRIFFGRCASATETVHRKVDDIESFVLQRLCSTYQKKISDFF